MNDHTQADLTYASHLPSTALGIISYTIHINPDLRVDNPSRQFQESIREYSMRFVFITPPFFGWTMPQLGIPSIRSALYAKAPEVESREYDLNAEYIRWAFSPLAMEAATVRIEQEKKKLEKKKTLTGLNALRYHKLAAAWLLISPTVSELQSAVMTLRSKQIKSIAELEHAAQIIENVLEILSAAWWPSRLMMYGHDLMGEETNLNALLEMSTEKDKNPFFSLVQQCVRNIVEWRADLVGISISTRGQLLAGVTLSRLLYEAAPGIPIIWGGSLPILHQDISTVLLKQVPGVKGIALGEGENTVIELAHSLSRFGHFRNVAGLAVRDGDEVIINDPSLPPSSDEIRCPVFDADSIGAYLTPEPVLPVLTSRGCPWRRCAFCTHHMTYKNRYDLRSTSAVVDDIQNLSRRYRTGSFYFVDESISANRLFKISQTILDRSLQIRWGAESRMEQNFTPDKMKKCAEAGCRVLSWGMESAVQPVLDKMKKGTKVENFLPVLKSCRDAGIRNHCMAIVGFPGEHTEDAMETRHFLERHANLVDLIGFSPFTLGKTSPVANSPEEFGVSITGSMRAGHLLEENLSYQVSNGISMTEAYNLYRECPQGRKGPAGPRVRVLGRIAWLFASPPPAVVFKKSESVRHDDYVDENTAYVLSPKVGIGLFRFPIENMSSQCLQQWRDAKKSAVRSKTSLFQALISDSAPVIVSKTPASNLYLFTTDNKTWRLPGQFALFLRALADPITVRELKSIIPKEFDIYFTIKKFITEGIVVQHETKSINYLDDRFSASQPSPYRISLLKT